METYDFDGLWDYGDPAGTEQKFRQLLPEAEKRADREYHLQLLTQIARTLGLQRRFDESHAVLDQVEPELSEGVPIAHIRYLLERGRAFRSGGDPDKARPFFLEAWERGGAAGDDFYTVDAAHMMAMVEPTESGLDWNMRAIHLAEASDQARARGWLGSLFNNTGWSYHDLGEYEKALDLFERALAFRLAQGDPGSIRIARWCVARCYRSLGRLREALEVQLALLDEAQAAGQPDGYIHEELGELLLALGRPEEARPHFQEAHALLSQDPWLVSGEPERLARLKKLGQAGA